MHLNSNGHAEYGGNTVTSPQDVHVYPVEWAPAFIKWFIDGAQFHEINIASGTGGTEEFQKPFFLLLNLALAGNWPGQTVDKSKLPATMAGDYGRGYQLSNPPPPLANSVATVYRDCNGAVIMARITRQSAAMLDIAPGHMAYAIVKAVSVSGPSALPR